jgi:hypothetical protein
MIESHNSILLTVRSFFLFLLFIQFLIFIEDSHQTKVNKQSMSSIATDGIPVKFADNLFSNVCNK